MEDPFKNETFVEKFRSTFISKMKEIPKKLKMKDAIVKYAEIVRVKQYGV